MKMNTTELLEELVQKVNDHILRVQTLAAKPEALLKARKNAASWNVLECIEHLNRYADFYLPEIKKQVVSTRFTRSEPYFSPGVLGSYFVKSMQPGPGIKKMNTFKDKDPINTTLSNDVTAVFITQQRELLLLLNRCRHIDITRAKTSISIAPFIKLRLGDTLRFLVAHNERHVQQAERAAAHGAAVAKPAMAAV